MNLLKTLSVTAALVALAPLSAVADSKTEAYVAENANEVLMTLNDPSLTPAQRTQRFSTYMDKFADFNAISNFAIGKYSRRFSASEMDKYRSAFRDYALAIYQNELDVYRGESVSVKNSVDRSATDSIVNTTIKREDGKDMNVRWRVLTRKGKYQVVDVALNIDGNLIWLGIEQRAQFISILDRTNGSALELIKTIEKETQRLNAG